MSADLQWQIVRKNHAYILRNRVGTRKVFSTEAGNLTNKHSYSANGFVNSKSVDISAGEGNSGVVVTVKRKGTNQKPKQQRASTKLARNPRKAIKSIAKTLESGYYRRDLSKAAKAKVCAVLASQKVRAPKPKTVRRNKATATA